MEISHTAPASIWRQNRNIKRTIILGVGSFAEELIREIRARPQCQYSIAGVITETPYISDTFLDLPVLGSFSDFQEVITRIKPDRIIIALGLRRASMPISELIDARISKGIIIEDGQQLYETITGKIAIESITPGSVIFSMDYRPARIDLILARVMSIILSIAGLICLSPLLLLTALAIKIDSRGPVFFTQNRIGMGGRPFKLLKFRTMHPDNDKLSEWVRDNGHRITRTGRWLRKFRIDELPQFINVLAGDMNLVGPRPHPYSNYELLVLVSRNTPESGRPIPYYSLRSLVRPGITGWAQVRYKYANDINEEIEKIRFDLYYVKHFSIWLDIRILFETIKVVFLGRESTETKPEDSEKLETVR